MDPLHHPASTFHDLSVLAGRVLQNIRTFYEENNELSDSSLIQLQSVYGDITEKALQLLENSVFVCFTTDTGDKKSMIYQVTGLSGVQYIIYPSLNFCECSAYKYHVCKSKPVYLTCKHRLATQLAEITNKFKEETISRSAFVEIMLSSINSECT